MTNAIVLKNKSRVVGYQLDTPDIAIFSLIVLLVVVLLLFSFRKRRRGPSRDTSHR